MKNQFLVRFFTANVVLMLLCVVASSSVKVKEASTSTSTSSSIVVSAVGDPGMRRDGLRVAFEAWNFCNEVGKETSRMGSPRAADCFDLSTSNPHSVNHKVTEADNKLGVGKPFPGLSPKALNDPDLYAAEKEVYLGSLCEVKETPNSKKPWQFWMIMLKNGNYDTKSALCPQNGKKVPPFAPGKFPCFGDGCMNQPLLYHQPTSLSSSTGNSNTNDTMMRGGFNGTYDLGSGSRGINNSSGISYFEVIWEKKVGIGSWVFSHKLKTSKLYPWLMLYLRADATKGFSGGYHYATRGMLKTLPESPNFKVRLSLDVKQGGGAKSQFYLIDMGSCWKNNGAACDGDVVTDVTRYSEMIINPQTLAWCNSTSLGNCPHSTAFQTTLKFTEMTLQISLTRLTITTVLLGMPSTWKNLTALVILTAILRHRSWFSCFLIQFGPSMAIQLNKETVGLGMLGLGSSMLVVFPVDSTSIRIQEPLLQKEYGHLLMWELKYLLATKMKWQNGV
ncbi:hypothetical protein LOK49_LG15G00028 [Camellia lanceoleosa]|uniref:Uncharacterized protein n=1 Tax=Camellia lanceoleosa TaxID=1840588 RepID=A0ACC0FA37_9ERIC|nr:hypothetical protein LOK49_LG15G00028 [Camellia lanceoleosa]